MHRPIPKNTQAVMTVTLRTCYNLERNQRFNSPYEFYSYLETR